MSRSAEAELAPRAQDEFTISQLAASLDLTPRAIRFYEAARLISPRRIGTMRVYSHRDRARLVLILRGKRLGFSLAEIREWLELYALHDGQARQTRLLLERVRRRIGDLERQRRDLDLTLEELREIEQRGVRHLEAEPADRQRDEPPGVCGRGTLTT